MPFCLPLFHPSRPKQHVQDLPWPGWLNLKDLRRQYPEPSLKEYMALPTGAIAARWSAEERQWTHIQSWLQSKGYLLRPRFRRGWTPAWPLDASSFEVHKYEESIDHSSPGCGYVIDAIRMRDGARVVLKRFELPANGRTELDINTLLSSEPFKSCTNNPALPMLDVIYAPDQCFMVFAQCQDILIKFDPDTVGEGLDFVEQTLEGIVFLHANRIAHRDCSVANLVMDPSRLYRKGIHFDHPSLDARGKRLSYVPTRTAVGGVKYYFIDFGESIKFSPGHYV